MQNHGKYLLLIFMMTTLLFAAPDKETFKFTMQADKHTAYLGEPVKITFKFKYPIDLQIAEANFAPPTFHDFWIKPGKDVPNTIKEGYHIYRLDYIVTPQKAGLLEIEPARMDIGILTSKKKNTLRFDRVKWKSIFSNPVKIEVKALPENVSLFGNYKINATVDKNSTKANEPVNLTVQVTGTGNIEDIDDFSIESDIATVYTDKAKRKTRFQKGFEKTVMTQKFAFIADQNFTIPPLSITYFDSQSKKIKTIQTKPIPIYVKQKNSLFTTPKLEKKENTVIFPSQKPSFMLWILSLAGAFFTGIILTLLWNKKLVLFGKQQGCLPVEIKIKKARTDKKLLTLLLPYSGKSTELDKIIEKLEANLYEGAKYIINRKDLAKKFKEYVTISQEDANIPL